MRAFILDLDLPAAVLGPVDCSEFARLARRWDWEIGGLAVSFLALSDCIGISSFGAEEMCQPD